MKHITNAETIELRTGETVIGTIVASEYLRMMLQSGRCLQGTLRPTCDNQNLEFRPFPSTLPENRKPRRRPRYTLRTNHGRTDIYDDHVRVRITAGAYDDDADRRVTDVIEDEMQETINFIEDNI